jgi:hypothetical protein
MYLFNYVAPIKFVYPHTLYQNRESERSCISEICMSITRKVSGRIFVRYVCRFYLFLQFWYLILELFRQSGIIFTLFIFGFEKRTTYKCLDCLVFCQEKNMSLFQGWCPHFTLSTKKASLSSCQKVNCYLIHMMSQSWDSLKN